jgi:hypothetical protein
MESMGKRGHGWVRGLCYVAGKRKTTEGVSMHTVNENAAGQAENRFRWDRELKPGSDLGKRKTMVYELEQLICCWASGKPVGAEADANRRLIVIS